MSAKELSPDSFTFQSFRHSQGDFDAQLLIFRYFSLSFGIEPELNPSPKTIGRYRKFIGRAGMNEHLQFGSKSGPQNTPGTATEVTFERLRRLVVNPDNFDHSPLGEVISRLAMRIIYQELRILGHEQPWLSAAGNDSGRQQRLAHRIASGKTSFLHYYGLGGNTTGYNEFDQMYQDMWSSIGADRDSPTGALITGINDLSQAIANIEHAPQIPASVS